MFYNIDGTLTELPTENPIVWENCLGILTPEEVEEEAFPACFGRYRSVFSRSVRFCKVEQEPDYLYGTLLIPDKNVPKRSATFSFFLWENNLLFVGDSGYLLPRIRAIQEVKGRAAWILCDLLTGLIQDDLPYLEEMENRAAHMESSVLGGTPENFDHKMMAFRKELAAFSHYYSQLADLAASLQEGADDFFTTRELRMLKLFAERAGRLREETLRLREYSMQIREVYQAQIDIHQNKIMKILTVVTTLFLPLSLIAGWYGMNFKGMPELTWDYGYPAVCLLGLVIVLFCIWFFKRKKFW